MRPLCIDLFCGLGGWTDGFLAEGYDCVGFDIERHDYGSGGYPGELVLQDILTVHGSQFREASCIVASPPCQRYSYMAMPWTRAKQLAAWHRESPVRIAELNVLFDACFRIQLEASKSAGRYIPLVVENVKGAQPWVGRAKWHYGSFYLWGDVPALMPFTFGGGKTPAGNAKGAPNWCDRPIQRLCDSPGDGSKNNGGSWFAIGSPGQTSVGQNPDGRKVGKDADGGYGGGFGWDDSPLRRGNSKIPARKAASAQIAKIPLPLAQYIARVFKPEAA